MQETLEKHLGMLVKSIVYHNMELGEKQQVVLKCLEENPDGLTDKEISFFTGLSLSCVCGRRNELMHRGLVEPLTIYSYIGGDGEWIPNIVWGIKGKVVEDEN